MRKHLHIIIALVIGMLAGFIMGCGADTQAQTRVTRSMCLVQLNPVTVLLVQGVGVTTKWDLPGGTIERGEYKRQTAIRETYEETGLRVKVNGKIGDFGNTRVYSCRWEGGSLHSGQPGETQRPGFYNIYQPLYGLVWSQGAFRFPWVWSLVR